MFSVAKAKACIDDHPRRKPTSLGIHQVLLAASMVRHGGSPWRTSSATDAVKRSSKARVRCSCSKRPRRSSGTCHGTPGIQYQTRLISLKVLSKIERKVGSIIYFLFSHPEFKNLKGILWYWPKLSNIQGIFGSNLMTQRSRRLAMRDWLSGLELSNR